MEKKKSGESKFVLQVLPWIIGAAALVIYLLTFNPWVSFFNAATVAKLAGWQWYPELNRPLYFLTTYPLRWLPTGYIPLALNLFSVACGALIIGQLARCVALLPYDRTQDQRLREHSSTSLLSIKLAWVPPVLAACACGLQMTFWDYATTGSPIILSLLLFAYVVRNLLEYRNDGRESRLTRTAFVYGLGMANDTAITGFFPLFLIGLVWLRGRGFFKFSFLLRMFVYGLTGLSIFLLLPLLAGWSESVSIDFWAALKSGFYTQKSLLLSFPKRTLLILAATTVLPAILILIRWAYGFGDNSQLGTALTAFVFHIVHAMFLFVCVWTAFDSPFSPRERGFGYPFLTFYFLGALSIGYFSGYFLLVFQRVPSERPSSLLQGIHGLSVAVVVALLIAVPTGLTLKNLPHIRKSNGPILKQYTAALAGGLPQKAVLLSDDLHRLVLLRSWLALQGRDGDYLSVETPWLVSPSYQRYLIKTQGAKWPASEEKERDRMYSPIELVRLLSRVMASNDVYYLHPSFGYYFESFYLEPHRLVYKLQRYGTNVLLAPPLTPELVKENEDFWNASAQETLPAILKITKPKPVDQKPDGLVKLWKSLRVQDDLDHILVAIGAYYSRSLNHWGVEMQKLNHFETAAKHFETALDLKPDNVVAEFNLECNRQIATNAKPELKLTRSVEDLFGKYRSWDEVMALNGPFDEPSFCFAASLRFGRSRLYRQSAQALDRVRFFAPDNVNVVLLLGQINIIARLPDEVLASAKEVRENLARYKPTSTNLTDLATLEGMAHLLRKEMDLGASILENVANSKTNNPRSLDTLFKVFCSYGLYTNALGILDRQLAADAEDVNALINQAFVYSKLKDYEKAIPPLTQVLTIQTNNPRAMFNRAIAYLYNNDLAEAQQDYEKLQVLYPKSYQIYFGMAEIALRRHDTNSAIKNYEAYLTNSIPDAPETKLVEKRLKELKGIKEPEAKKAD